MGRRLGQHFLAKKSILESIAAAACDDARVVVEIGPGKGALTEALLERADRVIAIEIDSYLVHYLRDRFRAALEQGRLTLVEGDILKTDLSQFGEPIAIVGNLPYYITSPIFEKVLALGNLWTRAVFLVQAEVAARITAQPGIRDFGYLSVECQLLSRPEILCDVPRSAFRPPPKVDSAVVRLAPRDPAADFGIADVAAFLRFASACFRYKRKTLRNNLAAVYDADRVSALPEAGLRAEALSVAELAAIFTRLSSG